MQSYLKKVGIRVVPGVTEEGEVISITSPIHILVNGDSNFTMWLSNLDGVVQKIKSLVEFKLLYWIGRNLKYNEPFISLHSHYKREIEKQMKISVPAIDRAIRSLKKQGVLISLYEFKSSMYRVNSAFLWKGDSHHRKKDQLDLLTKIRESNLPDKEKQELVQVKRYAETYFDFSKVKSA
jgi:Firmicute plasmid replication protein (RepL)